MYAPTPSPTSFTPSEDESTSSVDSGSEYDDNDNGIVLKNQRRSQKNTSSVVSSVEYDIEHSLEDFPRIEHILAWCKNGTNNNAIKFYFVTYKGLSYLHARWVPESTILTNYENTQRLKRYLKTSPLPSSPSIELYDPKYTTVDRILAARSIDDNDFIFIIEDEIKRQIDKEKNQKLVIANIYYNNNRNNKQTTKSSKDNIQMAFLVKWCGLSYSNTTWERYSTIRDDAKIAEFTRINSLDPFDSVIRARPLPSNWKPLDRNLVFKNGNHLREWQWEGVDWLLFNWYQKRGSVMADEMGLGKTIMAIVTLNYIRSVYSRGPFLVVAPLSTLENWKREINIWSDLNCVVYQGSKADREIIRHYETRFWNEDGKEISNFYKFDVFLCSYESVMVDTFPSQVSWKYCIIDEGHRIKNRYSKLFRTLSTFRTEHRILMTGTPIQNNTEELWNLLSFIHPSKFSSLSKFNSECGDVNNSENAEKLHSILKPYLLRRLKEDVAKNIPPKEETIIEVELTALQKQYYRAVLKRNREFLYKGLSGSNVPRLVNIVMELRKVCSHPFLIRGVEEKYTKEKSYQEQHEMLIACSGKMVFIDKLLPNLLKQGHKVLIFSQFKIVLDLLENFLRYKEYLYERLDGEVRGNDRQAAIDRFSSKDSNRFIFLLSTRAGGLGINLARADTVIIHDSDWNPHWDIQAQARCHRIGQTSPVKVFRLVTTNTYEKQMFLRASIKLGFDQAIMRFNKVGESSSTAPTQLEKAEIDALLKQGAYDIMNESNDSKSEEFCEEDIDKILSTRSILWRRGAAETGSTFSKASFQSAQADTTLDVNAPDFWERVMSQDSTSAPRLLCRLQEGSATANVQARKEFLKHLNEEFDNTLSLHQRGTVSSHLDSLLSTLRQIINNNKFTEAERGDVRQMLEDLEHPRRQRKAIISDSLTIGRSKNSHLPVPEADLLKKLRALTKPNTNTQVKEEENESSYTLNGFGGVPFTNKERHRIEETLIAFGSSHRIDTSLFVEMRKHSRMEYRTLPEFIAYNLAMLTLWSSICDDEDSMLFSERRKRLESTLPRKIDNLYNELTINKKNHSFFKITSSNDNITSDKISKNENNDIHTTGNLTNDENDISTEKERKKPGRKRKEREDFQDYDKEDDEMNLESFIMVPFSSLLPSSEGGYGLASKKSPKKITVGDFPSLLDPSFARHVVRRLKRWSRYFNLGSNLHSEIISSLDMNNQLKSDKKNKSGKGSQDINREILNSVSPNSILLPGKIKGVPIQMWWWGINEDKNLLSGCFHYGIGPHSFNSIRNDSNYCFLSRMGSGDSQNVEFTEQGEIFIGEDDKSFNNSKKINESSLQNNNNTKRDISPTPPPSPDLSKTPSIDNHDICICGSGHLSSFMVACDLCGVWFHGSCVGMTKTATPDVWHCPRCKPWWPSCRSLELRVKALVDALMKVRKIETRNREIRERKEAKLEEKKRKFDAIHAIWTKREKHDLLRALTVIGDNDEKKIIDHANLKRKTPEQVKRYIEQLLVQAQWEISNSSKIAELNDNLGDDNDFTASYCFCGQPSGSRLMIGCDSCTLWFHADCVQIDKDNLPDTWNCPECSGIPINNLQDDLGDQEKLKKDDVIQIEVDDKSIKILNNEKGIISHDNEETTQSVIDIDIESNNTGDNSTNEETTQSVIDIDINSSEKKQKGKKRGKFSGIKKHTEKEISSKDYLSEPQKSSLKKSCENPLSRAITIKCVKILHSLMNHKLAGPFLEAVDPIMLGIPSYWNIISHPMDLGSVLTNLRRGSYRHKNLLSIYMCSTTKEFADDVRLVWNNCYIFNRRTSKIGKWALLLSNIFEKSFAQLLHSINKNDEKDENIDQSDIDDDNNKPIKREKEKYKELDLPPPEIIDDTLTLVQSFRIVERVSLMSDIKKTLALNETQFNSNMKIFCKYTGRRGLPSWWNCNVHDKVVLESIAKHGIGKVKDILSDKIFCDAWDIPCNEKSEHTNHKEFLEKFLMDRVPCIKRLQVMCDVLLGRKTSEYFNDDNDTSDKIGKKKGTSSPNKRGREEVQVPRDTYGNIIFPFYVRSCLIHSLGTICTSSPSYHTENYIWPIGFESSRMHPSFINPDEKRVQFYSKILYGDESPIFEITADDSDRTFQSATPSGAWCAVLQEINKIKKNKRSTVSVSGPEMYGLSDITIKKLIEDLPGSDKCFKYIKIDDDNLIKDKKEREKLKTKGKGKKPKTKIKDENNDSDYNIIDYENNKSDENDYNDDENQKKKMKIVNDSNYIFNLDRAVIQTSVNRERIPRKTFSDVS